MNNNQLNFDKLFKMLSLMKKQSNTRIRMHHT